MAAMTVEQALAVVDEAFNGYYDNPRAKEALATLREAAKDAERLRAAADIGRAFLAVLADPDVAWRETGAQPFIERVAKQAALAPKEK